MYSNMSVGNVIFIKLIIYMMLGLTSAEHILEQAELGLGNPKCLEI